MKKHNILFVGASTSRGGYVAQRLIDAGHKVYRIGKGGPDYNIDLTRAKTMELREILKRAILHCGVPIDTVVYNVRYETTRSLSAFDDRLMQEMVNLSVLVPLQLRRAWINASEPRKGELENIPQFIVFGDHHDDEIGCSGLSDQLSEAVTRTNLNDGVVSKFYRLAPDSDREDMYNILDFTLTRLCSLDE